MYFQKKPQSRRTRMLREEKAIIRELWKQRRARIICDLSEPGESPPTDEEVKEFFDLLIKEAREKGILEKMLNRYLQLKIEEQRKCELGK